MSKYTTEVRYICEHAAGYSDSRPASDIDTVLNESWDKIFTTHTEFFREDYRSVLCKKILKHYYLREIGSETVGIWKYWMNLKLEEIMPYFNQLYRSALLEFNPLQNTNMSRSSTRTVNREDISSSETSGSSSSTSDLDSTTTTADTSLYSDTPQGSIAGLDTGTYLTNATKDNGSNVVDSSTENSESYSRNDDGTLSSDSTDTFIEAFYGNSGENYSEMLTKFRDTILNIDMQVIEEFKDLFINLW